MTAGKEYCHYNNSQYCLSINMLISHTFRFIHLSSLTTVQRVLLLSDLPAQNGWEFFSDVRRRWYQTGHHLKAAGKQPISIDSEPGFAGDQEAFGGLKKEKICSCG
jgi:hypothetical protein